MKKYRYLIAGGLSLFIHGIALSFAPAKHEMKIASHTQGEAVSVQFVSVAQPAKPVTPEPEKKVVEKKTQPKEVKPPKQQAVKKAPKSAPQKPMEHKTEAVKKPKPQITPKRETEEKQQPEKKKIETASTNAASSSKPKMVDKATFSAKPTPVSYPRLAQKRGWQGDTLIEIWINEDGKQIKQSIVNSSGHEILDKAAIKAVTQWQFQRRSEQGQRIAYRVQVPVNFKLK